MSNQFGLLHDRRFLPFFGTQFLGAFNDNLYKNSLVILLTFHAGTMTTLDPQLLVNLCAGIFILPFFLFSASAGQLADKYEKSWLIRVVKVAEIGIMVLAAIGFWTSSLWLLLLVLFGMGLHSTLFGPVKYALLPQVLAEEELIGGNALVEAGTFIAILLGTIVGGVLLGLTSHGRELVMVAVLLVAMAGYLTSRAIPTIAAADPGLRFNWNFWAETCSTLRLIRQNRTVFLSILGISWFWFYGALFLSQFPGLAKHVLHGNEGVVTLLLALFSIGIGVGSMLCERLSGRMVEIGLVPFGSIGLSLFAIDLWWAAPEVAPAAVVEAGAFIMSSTGLHILVDLVAIGCFGGFFIVPLYALIQTRSEVTVRSRIIAGNNIVNAGFMVIASLLAVLLLAAGLSIPQLFLVTGLMNVAVACYIYGLVPEFLLRFLCWLLVHTIYRLEKRGIEHIPESGPALLVCNHVSLVDLLIISAACPRPIRFVVDGQWLQRPLLRFVLRDLRVIAATPSPAEPGLALPAGNEVRTALEHGDLVCLFPEGRITATGEILPFRIEVAELVEGLSVPVIPMALQGLWASIFSCRYGRPMVAWQRARLFMPVGLVVGVPLLAGEASSLRLRQEVAGLQGGER